MLKILNFKKKILKSSEAPNQNQFIISVVRNFFMRDRLLGRYINIRETNGFFDARNLNNETRNKIVSEECYVKALDPLVFLIISNFKLFIRPWTYISVYQPEKLTFTPWKFINKY